MTARTTKTEVEIYNECFLDFKAIGFAKPDLQFPKKLTCDNVIMQARPVPPNLSYVRKFTMAKKQIKEQLYKYTDKQYGPNVQPP